jgi:hypothetical protein
MNWRSAIYAGTLTHRRLNGPDHGFAYPIYMHLLDLDEIDDIAARLRWFGRNRVRPVAFYDRDHLGAPGATVKDNLRAFVEGAGHRWPGGRVSVLTHCRVFGYVFNPVSFFYCHRPDGELGMVVAEVNNTFGDRHPYVLPVERGEVREAGKAGPRYRWVEKKVMHVSPFYSLDGSYVWDFDVPGEASHTRVDVTLRGERLFAATLTLRRRELTDAAIRAVLVRYPLMTVKVIGAIHWEALKLWWKGAPFHSQPKYDPESARQGVA